MNRAYLGLGGNIGDREKNLKEALAHLGSTSGIRMESISPIYETEPVGYMDQDKFLNLVVEVGTSLTPYELLECCNKIEDILKRERQIRWGPRTVDIDVLLYNDMVIEEEKLTLPHPRMKERAFVLVPLYDISPCLVITGDRLEDLIKNINTNEVRRYNA